jgi:transposase InsO family protein
MGCFVFMRLFQLGILHALQNLIRLLPGLCQFPLLVLRSQTALAAENLFLRKQLAFFQERKVKPRRADDSTRWLLAALSRIFKWRDALVVVKPETLIRWHRKGFRLFWRWKSKPSGRPPLPANLRLLIRAMAADNISWGEERIANELKLKLGICVSPRTVGKYMGRQRTGRPSDPGQRWLTFIRNHADTIIAADFFTVVTANFRILYVLVVMEVGRRTILHTNVTAHPTAEWTLQQFREALAQGSYRYLIHDNDSIFSRDLDGKIGDLGISIMRTPVRAPLANCYCERLVGTLRRECLDFMIPLGERHLRHFVRGFSNYYNDARVHMSLGPGVPALRRVLPPPCDRRHSIPANHRVRAQSVLGGLHHRYFLEPVAA